MGCDIHIVFEKKEGEFLGEPIWLGLTDGKMMKIRERDYAFFGELAGVRCGGVLRPDAAPLGMPKDASHLSLWHAKRWEGDAHSHSYISLAEALFLKAKCEMRCAEFYLEKAKQHKDAMVFLEEAEKSVEQAKRIEKYPVNLLDNLNYDEKSNHPYCSKEWLEEVFKDYRMVFWFDN